MATTITQAFQQLKQNLEITGLQQSTVSTRQQNVRQSLANSVAILDSFLTGSYIRSTMIAPLKEADIDVFMVLDPTYYRHYNNQNGGQAGLLDYIKRMLLKTYTQTPDISRNGQAVTISFSDFLVDVVPGFNRSGGGYLIPNSISNTWIPTDPKQHAQIMSSANAAHQGNLVPLIKMIKAWNRNGGSYFRSFHLEVLALSCLDGVTISDFPSGIRFYFDKCRSIVTQKNPDPAGYGDDVGAYINTAQKVNESVARFQTAYERAIAAEGYAQRGSTYDAIETWKKVFGSYFPSYG